MNPNEVLDVGKDLLYTTLLLSLPALGVSLILGLVISIFQTVTSIQDQTLSFAPRLVAVGLVLVFTLPWALQMAVSFTFRMLVRAGDVTR